MRIILIGDLYKFSLFRKIQGKSDLFKDFQNKQNKSVRKFCENSGLAEILKNRIFRVSFVEIFSIDFVIWLRHFKNDGYVNCGYMVIRKCLTAIENNRLHQLIKIELHHLYNA